MKKILKILIVEDGRTTADNIENILFGLGYNGIIAHNSIDAIELFHKRQPDLVIMDIDLKGSELNGIEIAKLFNDICPTPLIYLTESKDRNTWKEVQKTDPAYYLRKPFDELDIERAVDISIKNFSANKENLNGFAFEKENNKYHKTRTLEYMIFHKDNGSIEHVAVDDILYCEADKYKTRVYKKDKKDFIANRHLGFYKQTLSLFPQFLKTGIAHVVNLKNVTNYYPKNDCEVTFSTGRKVELSRNGGKALKNHFDKINGVSEPGEADDDE
jgi:DNA-binding LytR/AlgR family response regulator